MSEDQTCPTGKVRWPNRLTANKALLKAWKSHSNGDTHRRERSAYLCETCSGWHLTSWTENQYRTRNQKEQAQ